MRQTSGSLLSKHGDSRSPCNASSARDRFAFLTVATLAGIATRLLIVRRPFFQNLLSRFAGRSRSTQIVRRRSADQSLSMLAQAIMGSDMATVATVFGPPRNAVVGGNVPPTKPTEWQSATWYYQLPRQKETAMAIRFELNLARRVEFFKARAA